MNKLMVILEIVILLFIVQMIFLKANFALGIPLLLVYGVYKYYTCRPLYYGYKAALAFNSKNYEESLELYEKAFNLKNVNINITLRYAYSALYCGKLDICKKALDSIDYSTLTKQEGRAFYKQTQGLYLWKTGNIKEAIKIYKDVDKEYEHTIVYESLGYLLILNKQFDEALEYNTKAYDYDNDSNVIVDNLAQTYFHKGDLANAKKYYLEMFSAERNKRPSFSEAYYYYGLILKEEGNLEDAKDYFYEALNKRQSFLSELSHDTIREELDKIDKLQKQLQETV